MGTFIDESLQHVRLSLNENVLRLKVALLQKNAQVSLYRRLQCERHLFCPPVSSLVTNWRHKNVDFTTKGLAGMCDHDLG